MSILQYVFDMIKHCRRGVAAIEFALIITPYLIMTFGIIEIGFYTLTISVLQSAVTSSTRLVRTGQISGLSPFLTNISSNTFGLVDVTKLQVGATAYTSLSSIPATITAGSGGFTTGSGNNFVVLSVLYQYQFLSPLVGNLISSSGVWSFSKIVVFRNEPFS